MFFFSGHICYVWDIIVVLCCIKCGDSCLKSPQSCKRRFFRDCLLEQLSKPLRPPTALCHCGFPCYITESVWPFVCPTSKHRVSSVEISALFSYSQVESVETTKKNKNIFIVPKILLFPDLLFVHCVTFRETKKCGTVVWFGRLRLEFLNFSFHFVMFGGYWELARLLGNRGTDGRTRDKRFGLHLSCPNISVEKDQGWSVTVEINVMYIFKRPPGCVFLEERSGGRSRELILKVTVSTKFVGHRIEF